MAHVFIVSPQTFKVHLEYMFAGTGSGDDSVDFLFDDSVNIRYHTEAKLIGMLSDTSRIRVGDKIIFFVTGISKFYGIFEAESSVFIDNDNPPYLNGELGKKLFYRIKIKPDIVFKEGISEYDYLDSLEDLNSPAEMPWSLIYRKLRANRGCTAITKSEYNLFFSRLSKDNIEIESSNGFTFNLENEQIVPGIFSEYSGNGAEITDQLVLKMIGKDNNNHAYEYYLQSYLIREIKNNNFLMEPGEELVWIGNEVSCGVGMQSIDILTITKTANQINVNILELKAVYLDIAIMEQINKYIRWVLEYFIPTIREELPIVIKPYLIGKQYSNVDRQIERNIELLGIELYRETNEILIKDVDIRTFIFEDNNINFNRLDNED